LASGNCAKLSVLFDKFGIIVRIEIDIPIKAIGIRVDRNSVVTRFRQRPPGKIDDLDLGLSRSLQFLGAKSEFA
jgi:hypothetical protein